MTCLYNGNVMTCVSSLNIRNENHDMAVKILKGRYENSQMLISSHIEALVKLNSVKHKNYVKGLRKIYDQVESIIGNLYSLNVDQKSDGTFLVDLLNEKLLSEICVVISRRFGEEIWTLTFMLEILEIELFAEERYPTVSHEIKQKKMVIQVAVFIIKVKLFHVFFVNQIFIQTINVIK